MVFRFHMIGAPAVEVEIAASDIGELADQMARYRFIEGRLAQPDADGVLAGILLATSRVRCVVEAG